MLQQTDAGLLGKHGHHVAKDSPDGKEALRGGADVVQPTIIQQDFLHNERGHGFGQLTAHLHGPQAQRDYLGREQEVYDIRVVHLNKSANDSKGGEAQVFEWPGFADRVQERVQEQGHVRLKEQAPGVGVGRDALEEGQGIAYPVGGMRGEGWRGEKRIDGDDLLEKGRQSSKTVPQVRRQLWECLPLLAQLQKRVLSCLWVGQIQD
mmetsp:Transcript_28753/g.80967  ORF Transcript_28753/g.80967 Transcript_28753/m.80967 type:complete len:207 (+) Transcript_28753:575-1195(+)